MSMLNLSPRLRCAVGNVGLLGSDRDVDRDVVASGDRGVGCGIGVNDVVDVHIRNAGTRRRFPRHTDATDFVHPPRTRRLEATRMLLMPQPKLAGLNVMRQPKPGCDRRWHHGDQTGAQYREVTLLDRVRLCHTACGESSGADRRAEPMGLARLGDPVGDGLGRSSQFHQLGLRQRLHDQFAYLREMQGGRGNDPPHPRLC